MHVGAIIGLVILGAIFGILARLLVPGRNPIGLIMTVLVGIVGAVGGGYIGSAIGTALWVSWVIGIVIAAVLVALLSGFRRRARH